MKSVIKISLKNIDENLSGAVDSRKSYLFSIKKL